MEEEQKNEFMPICPICKFHAEMYFGEWQMCIHQRRKEQELARDRNDARSQHQQDFPEDARARTFDGGF